MTPFSGIIETLEHGLYLVQEALDKVPSNDPRFIVLRGLMRRVSETVALSDMRVALGEVEADFSARAQAAANDWPEETTKPE